jgi:murein DD-endopeptidase MepM/ murein hydrolase activator NlpD
MKKLVAILFIFMLFGLPAFVYFSPMFEKTPPKITIKNYNGFWNLRDHLHIHISDKSLIKYYKVTLINSDKSKVLDTKELLPSEMRKNIDINIKVPEFYQVNGNQVIIKVEATDSSKWNWFAGNNAIKKFDFAIDTTPPITEVINNNYAIRRGGSGIAIVKVSDKYLKNAYIKISNRDNPEEFYKFKLTPFYKKDYYISLLAWPYNFDTFSADLVAKDMAGNISISHIPIRWILPRFKHQKIKISENFIREIDIPLLQKMNMNVPNDLVKVFKLVNEKVRKINEDKIYKITNVLLDKKIDSFYIRPFRPMKSAAKEAGYGEIRSYIFDGKVISKAVHKGVDLASYKHARLYASNSGKVIFKGWLGIYGNTLALYHKLGLVSTYSHCSGFNVQVGSLVSRGTVIANSGSTGAVFGDHLHFGIYIQGIPVTPIEWMDSHWIRDNITNIILKAKRFINK